MEKLISCIRVFILVLLIGCLVACGNLQDDADLPQKPAGRLILWYLSESFNTEQIEKVLGEYIDLFPETKIILTSVTNEDAEQRLEILAQKGMLPDLLFLSNTDLPYLVNSGYAQDLSQYAPDTSIYYPTAVETSRFNGKLYALPLVLDTTVLYYNKKLTSEVPATLDDLIRLAREGKTIGIDTSFYDSLWGVHAFGGHIFDHNGALVEDQGALANWLKWLITAQSIPSFVLSYELEPLQRGFMEEKLAYYIATSDELPMHQGSLGEETIGVAPLPCGPKGKAAPFLQTEVMIVSNTSTPAATTLALHLMRFMSSPEQQRRLTLGTWHVPANSAIIIDSDISPDQAAIQTQVTTAVYFHHTKEVEAAITLGDGVYREVLSGMLDPAAAYEELVARIKQATGEAGSPPDEDEVK